MRVVPVSLKVARAFVQRYHRHNNPPVGHKFSVGLVDHANRLIGVAVASRPVAQALATYYSLEISRTCTTGEKNANSMLYGAIRRAAVAMGYQRIYTYTQANETGASLRAAGFRIDKKLEARANWHESGTRGLRRSAADSTYSAPRIRWVWP